MIKVTRIFLLVSLVVVMAKCEKDDICVDGDTPLLVIGFYNVNDPESFKAVNTLRIRELSTGDSINDIFEEGQQFHQDRRTVSDSTEIPLNAATTSSAYEFIINSADDGTTGDETGTIDTVEFNYTVVENFISRGCGFVANYTELDTSNTVFTRGWIQKIEIADTTVDATNQIHVKIFH